MFPGLNFGGSSPRNADERGADADRLGIAFAIDEPVSIMSPVVFASPHSGRLYPPAFLESCAAAMLGIAKSDKPTMIAAVRINLSLAHEVLRGFRAAHFVPTLSAR